MPQPPHPKPKEPNINENVEAIRESCQRIEENQRVELQYLKAIWGELQPRVAASLKITFFNSQGEPMPSPDLKPGQFATVAVGPRDSTGQPSPATLSLVSFASRDESVFTVAPDPSNPNGAIVTAQKPPVLPDSGILFASATATEPDGVTTEQISGTDTVNVVAPAPPPPPVAASLGFTWGPAQDPPAASTKGKTSLVG